ncbi:MAG: 2,3-bisphosphoglycerate-independent phosphoglycerate mutase [Eggerthellaceae bacterium]
MSASSEGKAPACLIIMDGFGLAEPGPGNAISLADTPVLDKLFAERPNLRLNASGEAVGLPEGQMGNSEVGHLNIGAGRIVYQELTRINKACREKKINGIPELLKACRIARKEGSALHLMGLLSDGGVHSSNEHLYALLDMAADMGVRDILVHCFLDGRDVSPTSGLGYVKELQEKLNQLNKEFGSHMIIGSVCGRYYAMDRDNRWDRIEKAYDAIVRCMPTAEISATELISDSYEAGVTDEFFVPMSLSHRGVRSQDAVVMFNFRPDRAREITRCFTDKHFPGFDRRSDAPFPYYVCMTEYDASIDAPVAFPKEFPENVLADVLADQGLRQYHIAETEKYAHVTFFFNGGIEEPKAAEERMLIPSPKVATYDLKPEMSEPSVAQTLHDAILADEADVYIVNFANCDMVGHTGIIPAAKAAVEAVDAGVGLVLDAMAQKGGVTLVTADHGNADRMIADDGSPFTAHTTAQVPLILVDETGQGRTFEPYEGAALCDIAPTLLQLMGIEKPEEMTGISLLA